MRSTKEILEAAKRAKKYCFALSEVDKNNALCKMADAILQEKDEILAANEKDVENARGKISDVMLDRLRLDEKRIFLMAEGIKELLILPDPVGRILDTNIREDGLTIEKVSVPLGVVAIIYESRPNVTSDAAALLLKSGNVCVLRSGKEAHLTSCVIVKIMREALERAGLCADLINIVEDTDRASANEIMRAVGYVDLLIPRGGKGLISACVENASVPCIQTGTGICHVYVDEYADFDKALNIIENAKTSRPSVCNAEEVCLVNAKIADKFLPLLKKRLVDDRKARKTTPVELRLDRKSAGIIDGVPAGDADFDTEFLNYILAVKVVDDVNGAIEHISAHSTGHSDAIVTENKENADKFCQNIDSAALYVNASTRFTDGGEFGLGCEMGISTQKLHARGPMGLEELTTYKYIIHGNGHIR